MSFILEPEEMDFTIEKEGWNIYELSDGTTLKVRAIVLRVFKTKPPSPAKGEGFGIEAHIVVVAKAPSDKKKAAQTQPPAPGSIEKATKTKVGYTEKGEFWNTYLLPDNRRLKLRLVVTSVARVEGFYDMFGNPVYVVASDNITASEATT